VIRRLPRLLAILCVVVTVLTGCSVAWPQSVMSKMTTGNHPANADTDALAAASKEIHGYI
jgi:hypothetical protein